MLYGWAKGAEAMHLPAGVGFRVGQGTGSTHLVLQVCLQINALTVDTMHPCCLGSLCGQDATVQVDPYVVVQQQWRLRAAYACTHAHCS